MFFSRRQFLQAMGIAVCAGVLPFDGRAGSNETPLPVPPLLESRRGQPLFLSLQYSRWPLTARPTNSTRIWSINGSYPGPTVRVWRGDNVRIIWNNGLNEPVAMTVSGLQVPGSLAGGAARVMAPSASWSPVLPVRQPAAPCWYHAMTPGRMAPQLYNGLAGMWLIEDENSQSLPLPSHYGVDDFPLILQDKQLDAHGFPVYRPTNGGGFMGEMLLVNGVQNPYVNVARGWVRLRLLNASNARRYQLTLSNEKPFVVIAGDQGYLPSPVEVRQLSLAPGERREVLLDMSKDEEVTINAGNSAGLMDRLRGLFEPSGLLTSPTLLTLRSVGLLPLSSGNLPARLPANGLVAAEAVHTRRFTLGNSRPGINGAQWNRQRIDVQARQGTFERWIIHADLPQAFHLQGAFFLIERVNGARPLAEDRGFKDTVWVDGDVELRVFFPQPSSVRYPFIYYSQTLELADGGTAGQLLVRPAPRVR